MNNYITCKHVFKQYGKGDSAFYALEDVNFTIEEGEFVVILGPSGAGKSTLLNLLGGLDSPTNGEILIEGNNIAEYSDEQLTKYRGTDVGFVFQFYNLIPNLTLYENVALIKEVAENPYDAKEILTSVGLEKRMNQFPTQVSGGEQQRASIARAIAKRPKLLLCDEPTGAMDSETGIIILSFLQDLSRKKGHTVVIVTHNSALAQAADKVMHIKNGSLHKIVQNDLPKAVGEVEW